MVKVTSMNNHDCRENYQLQTALSQISNEMFQFEGLKTVIGKHSKSMTQPFLNRVLEVPDNIVGYCSDDGSEQKLVLPAGYYRFHDFLHLQMNMWNCFSEEYLRFTFNDGEELNVREAYYLLLLNHPELVVFERAIVLQKAMKNLSECTKVLAFFVQEDVFFELTRFCERKLLDEDANVRWIDILRFAELMTTIGILFKSFFIEIERVERMELISSALVRVLKFKIKNASVQTFDNFKNTLVESLKFLRENDIGNGTEFFMKTTLCVLETLKWQIKKASLLNIGNVQRMYQIFSGGCTFDDLDGPFVRIKHMMCSPSVPIVE